MEETQTQTQYPPSVQVTIQLNIGAKVLAHEGQKPPQNTSHHDT
jgi:hypothetical protein